ncbi:MAG: hypothetical protein AAGE76_08375 [Pseudomonadota bacterium]
MRWAVLAVLLWPAPAMAEISSMAECDDAIRANPSIARAQALAWIARGGSVPARLCAASALRAEGAPQAAAEELTALGQNMSLVMEPSLRGKIFVEAGLIWFELGNFKTAADALHVGAKLAPDTPGVLRALGQAQAEYGALDKAETALDRALDKDGADTDARFLRAQVRRAQGNLAGAKTDLDLLGDAPAIDLERAHVHADAGENKAAADLAFAIIEAAPDPDIAAEARTLLQTLAE